MKKLLVLFLILCSFAVNAQSDTNVTKNYTNLIAIVKQRAFIRKQPSPSSTLVEVASKGTRLQIVEVIDNPNYRKVKYNGEIGYIEISKCTVDTGLLKIETDNISEIKSTDNKIPVIPTISLSQNDSLKLKILNMQLRFDNIELHLYKSHKQYRSGTILYFLGTVISTGGLIGILADKEEPGAGLLVSGVGAFFQLIGGVIWIDSHKHIGRAGGMK